MSINLQRMIELADSVFAVKNDPTQLDVSEEVLLRLKEIHPATISEQREGDGPIAWVLVIPTTRQLMEDFVEKRINEKELFDQTPLNQNYDAVYLCSALVLDEFRCQGITKRLTVSAIKAICLDHQINHLFTWPFSAEGDLAAQKNSIDNESSIIETGINTLMVFSPSHKKSSAIEKNYRAAWKYSKE